MASAIQWTPLWWSERGASHVRSGLPNQDAIGALPDAGAWSSVCVLAASDGHGSPKSFRSDRGARWAVEIARDEVARAIIAISADRSHADLLARQPAAFEDAFVPVLRAIWTKWCGCVDGDLAIFPFERTEMQSLTEAHRIEVARHPRVAYGATLLLVGVTRELVAYAQLGDGDILTAGDDGLVRRPLPSDPRMFANATLSLSQDQAWREFRLRVVRHADALPALILVATDGYLNSFETSDGFERIASDYLRMLREEGLDAVQKEVPTWLGETSAIGSRDDISLGLICRKDAVETPALEDPNEEHA